ncbi:hypothetical protein ECP029943811_0839 [Escherichia coli P0299438.11]|nr:hypothetical protein ECP029943811_0839 [Escherichia coli P0299438.11]ENC22362.1 hypothetical protein ECP02994387_0753 [Escherichia coli P0299438.7]
MPLATIPVAFVLCFCVQKNNRHERCITVPRKNDKEQLRNIVALISKHCVF